MQRSYCDSCRRQDSSPCFQSSRDLCCLWEKWLREGASQDFLTLYASIFFISATGRKIRLNNSKGIKEQSFCCKNKSNHAVFFSEFLKAWMAFANCLSNLKNKLNFHCQHFEIIWVNCYIHKLCDRRGFAFFDVFLQLLSVNNGQSFSNDWLAPIPFVFAKR